jgi:hypothetical protein
MKKNSYNMKNIREAKKKVYFRISEDILFSSTDRYNDAYRCLLTAMETRDKFVLSLVLTHEPSQSTVYSNYWIFNTQDRCERTFDEVSGITNNIRDFVEKEGLKTVIAQYMLRHSLSVVSADVEDIYETAIPYIRNTIDKSTRGNLLKNIPTVPFRSQVGPESLSDVFRSVGAADNPVLPDNVETPIAYKHLRGEDGRNILPSQDSDFESSNGLKRQGLDIGKITETSSVLKRSTEDSVYKGRELSVKHYMKHTGATQEESSKFYDIVREISKQAKITVSLTLDELVKFLAGGPSLPEWIGFNLQHEKRLNRATGIDGSFSRGSLMIRPKTSANSYVLIIDAQDDDMFYGGDIDRTWNIERSDYNPDVSGLIYDLSAMADCKASSMICSMSQTDLTAGPTAILERLHGSDMGSCDVLISRPFAPESVSEILVANDSNAVKVRKILERMGKILPVSVVEESIKVKVRDEEPELCKPSTPQKYFEASDRVTHKPRLNNPSFGTVSDVDEGSVTVQWDNGDRVVLDTAEALMKLMGVNLPPSSIEGMVVYSLPGIDESAARTLSSLGIDPVTIYSLASHAKPPQAGAKGWEDVLIGSLSRLGLRPRKAHGYLRNRDGKKAFSPRIWVEARLPSGNRLVIDMHESGPRIEAGSAIDYVLHTNYAHLILE